MTYKGFNGVIAGEADEHDPLAGIRDMLDRFCAEDGSDGETVEMAAQILIAATEQALVARVGYAADLHR
ncbi:MAG TPA: hypothetical protein DGG94_19405 [Micromonosporaceae bacterium]|nr:hypothetical protein [Micromonosporaceae bacterium]HCU51936.1 hypothetical protein [Micromonosporaceae bacterium]